MESWDIPTNLTFEPPNAVNVQARVPHDSLWLHGHFPGQPILPAIALLSLVMNALRYFGKQRNLHLKGFQVRKARFTLPIRPGDTFEISISCRVSESELLSTFKVLVKEEMAGNGIMAARLTGL